MEKLFITMLRGANILAFFAVIIGALIAAKGMPANMGIFVVLGCIVGAGVSCGVIALFMKISDTLEEQNKLLTILVKQGRQDEANLKQHPAPSRSL